MGTHAISALPYLSPWRFSGLTPVFCSDATHAPGGRNGSRTSLAPSRSWMLAAWTTTERIKPRPSTTRGFQVPHEMRMSWSAPVGEILGV